MDAATPHERVAGLMRLLMVRDLVVEGEAGQKAHPFPMQPDYADFAAALKIILRRELLLVRIEQAQKPDEPGTIQKMQKELAEAEEQIDLLLFAFPAGNERESKASGPRLAPKKEDPCKSK